MNVVADFLRRGASCVLALALAACAGGASLPPGTSPAAAPVPAKAKAHKLHAKLRITIPRRRHHHKGARYLSSATQGLTLAVTGPNSFTLNETVGLTVSSNPQSCTSTLAGTSCVLTLPGLAPCPSPANCYSMTIATYDAISGCPAACAVAGENELSGNQDVGFTIAAGSANQVDATLDGIPLAVAIVPDATATVSGNMTNGFTASKCGSGTVFTDRVSVLGVDAGGNYILGAGAPVPSLTAATAAVSVATPGPTNPNRFVLTHSVSSTQPVTLTATVTPAAESGGSLVTATAPLTVTGAICGVFTEYPIMGASNLDGITEGPDGAVWFTDSGGNEIGRITTAGVPKEYAIPTSSASLDGITAGPDGAVWFAEHSAEKIGRITTDGLTVTEYSTGITGTPVGIASGPDSALWFTENNGNYIGRITTDGASVNQYPVPTNNARPNSITSGPDGALWFTELCAGQVGRVTTDGLTFNEYGLGASGATKPIGITSGPDGALWFAESDNESIGRSTTAGAISTFPTMVSGTDPIAITSGPDGAVWFSDDGTNKIGRMTTDGVVTEFAPPTASQLGQITLGSDGAIWFVENISAPRSANIARLQ
jgi:virginiamycin B lyase